ncbi:MAG: hypothetical protein NTX84_05595 [Nitrospirae bacterium]|nr:hypothetical protein [Nitrospirota bacterium]
MAQQETPTAQIMNLVTHSDYCTIEQLVAECPDLTWIQVFIEINRLRRDGLVSLTLKQPGYYVVSLVAQPKMAQVAVA